MEVLSFLFWGIVILLGCAVLFDLKDGKTSSVKIITGIAFLLFLFFLIIS